jgi:hypothetical protein
MQADGDRSPPVEISLLRCRGCQRPAINWTRILDPKSGERFEIAHCRFCEAITWSPPLKTERH